VSGATVSRVLSGRRDVPISAKTRKRVLDAMTTLGYRPNEAARSLASGCTQTIALLTVDSFTAHYASVARCVTDRARSTPFQVAVQNVDRYLADPEEAKLSLKWQADGLLLCDLPREFAGFVALLRQNHIPVISMGAYHAAEGDFVGVDLLAGATLAVEHLVQLGCRRIALMRASAAFLPESQRQRAYRDVLQAAGLEPELIHMPPGGRASARTAIAEHVRCSGCPDGIFCNNDDIAIGCYRGLCDMGVRVPEDVALVGCDGIEDTEYLECPLTTIVQPVAEMCSLAWEYLERRLEDPGGSPLQAVLPPRLAQRASTDRWCARPEPEAGG
jgi:LacI family transcriptional regulator